MNYEEYEVLIPPAHRYPRAEGAERSKFAEFVLLCLKHGIDIADMLDTYVKEFDLDRAVGSQLDFIGAVVGANRKLPFPVQGSDGVLGDDDFRLLIRSRIAANTWDGTNESLCEIMRNVFSAYGVSFEDAGVGYSGSNENMHMNYKIRGNFTDLQKQMLTDDLILPRPAGVSVRVDIIGTTVSTSITTDTRLASDFMQAGIKDPAEKTES